MLLNLGCGLAAKFFATRSAKASQGVYRVIVQEFGHIVEGFIG